MIKILLKRLLPALVGLVLVVFGGLWLYGYVGVKAGWIGPAKVPSLNAVSRSGADAAGGVIEASKKQIGL